MGAGSPAGDGVTATNQERLAVLEERSERDRKDIEQMTKDIRHIRTTLAEARGGWKTLVMVAGFAGAVGAGLSWLVGFGVVK